MNVVTREEMGRLDRTASERYGIPSLLLMENAGRAVFREVERLVRSGTVANVRIFCGKGNNGGDGFVVARHSHNAGIPTSVVILGDRSSLSRETDAGRNLDIVRSMRLEVRDIGNERDLEPAFEGLGPRSLLIDAVFGTGLRGEVKGLARSWIDRANSTPCSRLAIDIPTGLDSNDGRILGAAFRAHMTVTFGLVKRGLLVGHGPEAAGIVLVADISIPREEIERAGSPDGEILR